MFRLVMSSRAAISASSGRARGGRRRETRSLCARSRARAQPAADHPAEYRVRPHCTGPSHARRFPTRACSRPYPRAPSHLGTCSRAGRLQDRRHFTAFPFGGAAREPRYRFVACAGAVSGCVGVGSRRAKSLAQLGPASSPLPLQDAQEEILQLPWIPDRIQHLLGRSPIGDGNEGLDCQPRLASY